MKEIRIDHDGNSLFASYSDFVNLQESPAGFGETREAAIKDLLMQTPMRCQKAMWSGMGWPAGHCEEISYGPSDVMRSIGYYLEPQIARCEKHGGPSLDQAARDIAALSKGAQP